MTAASLNPLHRADGSAVYSSNGHSVIAAVNGPMEVQRRDELPEEAAIDVAVRPASGVGGVRERHLESIIQNTLRHVILVSAHPRTLIQITLQIVTGPSDDSSADSLPQASSNISILPALLQSSILALLSTSIPLLLTFTAALIAVQPNTQLVYNPASKVLKSASSIHVLTFSSKGELLIGESEGHFSIETWEEVYEKARQICHRRDDGDQHSEDVSMDPDEQTKLEDVLREAVQETVLKERRWKDGLD